MPAGRFAALRHKEPDRHKLSIKNEAIYFSGNELENHQGSGN